MGESDDEQEPDYRFTLANERTGYDLAERHCHLTCGPSLTNAYVPMAQPSAVPRTLAHGRIARGSGRAAEADHHAPRHPPRHRWAPAPADASMCLTPREANGWHRAKSADDITLRDGEVRKNAHRAALLEDRCRSCGCGRSVQRPDGLGSRTACRLLAVWLINDVPACRFLAVAWLKRGAQPAGPEIRHARHGHLRPRKGAGHGGSNDRGGSAQGLTHRGGDQPRGAAAG